MYFASVVHESMFFFIFFSFFFHEKISEEMVAHEHVFCEPALSAGQAGGYPEGEALLAE